MIGLWNNSQIKWETLFTKSWNLNILHVVLKHGVEKYEINS